ncbi:hypothetical protein IJ847_01040 [Candidatus Saccharibacteria bacterium]|nr:hypothetical protein [Candidatus Saccharibacteria bacterium]
MEKAYKLVTAQEVVTIAFTSVEAMMSGSKPAIKAPITITIDASGKTMTGVDMLDVKPGVANFGVVDRMDVPFVVSDNQLPTVVGVFDKNALLVFAEWRTIPELADRLADRLKLWIHGHVLARRDARWGYLWIELSADDDIFKTVDEIVAKLKPDTKTPATPATSANPDPKAPAAPATSVNPNPKTPATPATSANPDPKAPAAPAEPEPSMDENDTDFGLVFDMSKPDSTPATPATTAAPTAPKRHKSARH